MSDWEIIEGDCIEAMRAMPEASVDAIVTDPPYGLGFMGKAWDSLPPGHEVGKAFLHVLKPGGHLVAFGGTRTYHRLACALEDAGFEIRDSLMWVYGSGFPKSLDVSKAIDKAAGAEREVVGFSQQQQQRTPGIGTAAYGDYCGQSGDITAPATDAATEWQGWGTALKPSHEPVVLARKPLVGTVAANVEQHGTGALNVDGCRVGTAGGTAKGAKPTGEQGRTFGSGINGTVPIQPLDAGRWPPNLLLTHAADCTEEDCGETCPVAEMDRQSGELTSGKLQTHHNRRGGSKLGTFKIRDRTGEPCDFGGDSGGASRFFPRFRYVAKASSGERNAGLEGMPEGGEGRSAWAARCSSCGRTLLSGERQESPCCGAEPRWEATRPVANHHPTVKPVALMRWLCRLITPPGGTVLDPFAGSGTTLLAATQEGFRAIGIEREPEYAAIARRRVEEDAPLFNRGTA